MIKVKHVAAVLSVTALALSVTANTTWDYPDDIPVIEPVTVGLAGEQPADIVRYLLARGAELALISPDGTKIAFRYSVTGERQLWVVDTDGGWPTQLTFGSGITFFRWAPDGKHLLVGRDADGNEREGYYLLSVDGTAERQLLPLTDAFRAFGMFCDDGSQTLVLSPIAMAGTSIFTSATLPAATRAWLTRAASGFFRRHGSLMATSSSSPKREVKMPATFIS